MGQGEGWQDGAGCRIGGSLREETFVQRHDRGEGQSHAVSGGWGTSKCKGLEAACSVRRGCASNGSRGESVVGAEGRQRGDVTCILSPVLTRHFQPFLKHVRS